MYSKNILRDIIIFRGGYYDVSVTNIRDAESAQDVHLDYKIISFSYKQTIKHPWTKISTDMIISGPDIRDYKINKVIE